APLLRHRLQAHRTGPEAGRPVRPTGSNSTRTGGVAMTKELAQRTERDPNGIDPHSAGAKLDAGKVEPELIQRGFARALLAVADVGTYGATKYTRDGWQDVPAGVRRYTHAMSRHLSGEHRGAEGRPR